MIHENQELFDFEIKEEEESEEELKPSFSIDENDLSNLFIKKFLNNNKVGKSMIKNDYHVWVTLLDGTIFDPQFEYYNDVKRLHSLEGSTLYLEASWIYQFCFQLLHTTVLESFNEKELETMVNYLNTRGYVPNNIFFNFSFFNAYAFQQKYGGKICCGSIGWKSTTSDYIHYEYGGLNHSVLNYMGNLKHFDKPVMFEVIYNRKTLVFLSLLNLKNYTFSKITSTKDQDIMMCYNHFKLDDFEQPRNAELGSIDFREKLIVCFYELAKVLGIEVNDILDGVLENKITFKSF
jgi:hypothetical protein